MNYDWNPSNYIKVVEKKENVFLQKYMQAELEYITTKIENPEEKTFIDVGAGYGRVIPVFAAISKKVIAVELDKQALEELKRRTKQHKNTVIVECDAQNLSICLEKSIIDKPVVVCLQNSLGTPYGDPYKIISEMAKVAKNNNGELIISLFTQEGLKDYGVPLYDLVFELTGKPDLEKTDFENGNFVSRTGYKSHWWKPEEREEILRIIGGKLVGEVLKEYFYILHVKY